MTAHLPDSCRACAGAVKVVARSGGYLILACLACGTRVARKVRPRPGLRPQGKIAFQ